MKKVNKRVRKSLAGKIFIHVNLLLDILTLELYEIYSDLGNFRYSFVFRVCS